MQTVFRTDNPHDLNQAEIDKIELDLNDLVYHIQKTINKYSKHKHGIVIGAIQIAFQYNLWAEDIDQVYKHFNVLQK